MIRTKKIAILAIIAMVFTLMPAAMFAATDNRLAGADRISTAIAIADEGFPTASTVVLAPADQANLVDALAAAPLAGKTSPILLTFKSALNDDVKAKIAALGATKVYAIGAISDAVVAEVEAMAGVTVEKLSGANRWATADAVNAKLTSPAGTFVVGYNAIADALSVASYAAANNYAIVLTKADGTVDASKLVGSKTYLVGGTAVVADYAGATRLGGADRFATNAAVASGLTFSYGTLYVANGLTMVDALSAASLAAKTNSFVALASATSVAANVESANVIALGGTAAVTNAVRASVDTSTDSLAVASVSAINAKQIEIKFNKAVDEATAESTGNYLVESKVGADLAKVDAVLQSDDKTVLLTMDSSLTSDGKSVLVTFTIKADAIQEKNESSSVVPLYVKILDVTDKVAPTIVKIESKTNEDTAASMKITFSEPVSAPTIKLNGTTKAVNAWTKGNTVAEITGLTLDATKTHTVEVVNLTDYASNVTSYVKQTFSIVTDTAKPAVSSVVGFSDNSVVVTFSKKMDTSTIVGTQNILMKSEDLSAIGTANAVAYPDDDTDTKFIVQASDTLFGTKTSRSITLAFIDDAIKDNLGNKMPGTTKSITLTKDTTAPTVTGVKAVKDSAGKVTGVEVQFSESIAAATYASANITTVDKNGVIQAGFFDANSVPVTLGKSKVVFTKAVLEKLTDNYSFTFAKGTVQDASEKGNDSATATVTVYMGSPDASKFEVADGSVVIAGSVITITYPKTVKGGDVAGSATSYNNYSLGAVNLADALIYLNAAKTELKIDFSNCDVPDSDTAAVFTINNVQNTDGVTIKPFTKTFAVSDNVAPVLLSARVLSKNEIELTFDEKMDVNAAGAVKTEFLIKQSGTTLSAGDSGAITATLVPGYDKKVKLTLSGNTVDAAVGPPVVVAVPFELDLNKTITIKTLDITPNLIVDLSEGNEMKKDITVTVEKP